MDSLGKHDDQQTTQRKAGRPLEKMFNDVPKRYDLLNRLLTMGFDECWRRRAARLCLENSPSAMLDLCCGTGDLVRQFGYCSGYALENGNLRLAALDYSPGMLAIARDKAVKALGEGKVEFVEGDASAMPFAAGQFDAVGIAFAFRNLSWHNPLKDAALAEVLRILKPGGRFVIVETSQPRNGILRWCMHTWLRLVTAPVGGMISGHREAYKYLALSARKFYTAAEVTEMLLKAGFAEVTDLPQLGGVAAIHVAVKEG